MHGVLGTRKQQNMPHPQIVMPMTWRDFCFEKETVDISLYTILSLFIFFFWSKDQYIYQLHCYSVSLEICVAYFL